MPAPPPFIYSPEFRVYAEALRRLEPPPRRPSPAVHAPPGIPALSARPTQAIARGSRAILDLGCGTGYAAAVLAGRFPEAAVAAVDISAGMLEVARGNLAGQRVELVQADMLEFLRCRPDSSADLVFSGWAIGYSDAAAVIRHAARTLRPGGVLAFVVNSADTLAPIFRAYRRCLLEFPRSPRLALWPRFPKGLGELAAAWGGGGLEALWSGEGDREIVPPADYPGGVLPWLLETGVLAGFDAVLPLAANPELACFFESCLATDPEPIKHHYLAAMLEKSGKVG